jgi:hypothetical protein
MSNPPRTGNESLSHSGFEKKGGYPSTGPVVSQMPQGPTGPAPGSKESDSKK